MRLPNLTNTVGKLRAIIGDPLSACWNHNPKKRLVPPLPVSELVRILGGRASESLITKIESKHRSLTPDLAQRISIATGVSAHWLLEGDTSKPIITAWGEPYDRAVYIEEQARHETPSLSVDPNGERWLCYKKAKEAAQKKLGDRKQWKNEQSNCTKSQRQDYDLAIESEIQKIRPVDLSPNPAVVASLKKQTAELGALHLTRLAALLITNLTAANREILLWEIENAVVGLSKRFVLAEAGSEEPWDAELYPSIRKLLFERLGVDLPSNERKTYPKNPTRIAPPKSK